MEAPVELPVGLPAVLPVADGELVTEGPLVGVLDGLADLELDKVVVDCVVLVAGIFLYTVFAANSSKQSW